jgi:hypothetical protein
MCEIAIHSLETAGSRCEANIARAVSLIEMQRRIRIAARATIGVAAVVIVAASVQAMNELAALSAMVSFGAAVIAAMSEGMLLSVRNPRTKPAMAYA